MSSPSPIFSAHSCSHCRNIQVRIPFSGEMNIVTDSELTGAIFLFTEVQGPKVLAASTSCAFFKWAIDAFRNGYTDEDMNHSWTLNGGIHEGHFTHYPSAPFVIFQWWYQGNYVHDLKLDWLTILAEPDDPSAQFISQRPENRSLDSTSAFSHAREWLSICQSKHHDCRVIANSHMPSCIMEIRDTAPSATNIRIVMNPPTVDYAAFSYCWGGHQPVVATKSTMKDMMSNIPYATLPKGLQDAITVTLKLGLRYLWVDALCIIQDDHIQKEREIAAMPIIYRNACVTICAARSRSCDEGFLHNIMAPGPMATAFRFLFYGPDCTIGSVVCFHSDDKYRYLNPIDHRAWPFQEFVMSRRVLKFGGFQRTWICLCDEIDEMEGVGNWWKDRDTEYASLRRGFHKASTSCATTKRRRWLQAVESYSGRAVTNPADRLLAISGIATTLGETTNDEYLAGIWREDFPSVLLWYVPGIGAARSDTYIAPSWSWAAVNGSVFFCDDEELVADPELELRSTSITLSEPKAPYGAVSDGSITVRGWIRRLFWTEEGTALSDPATRGDHSREMHAMCFPDYTDSTPTADFVVWCLQIATYNKENDVGPFGLILTTEDGKVFHRRGLFQYHPIHYEKEPPQLIRAVWEEQCGWKSNSERKTIVIE